MGIIIFDLICAIFIVTIIALVVAMKINDKKWEKEHQPNEYDISLRQLHDAVIEIADELEKIISTCFVRSWVCDILPTDSRLSLEALRGSNEAKRKVEETLGEWQKAVAHYNNYLIEHKSDLKEYTAYRIINTTRQERLELSTRHAMRNLP